VLLRLVRATWQEYLDQFYTAEFLRAETIQRERRSKFLREPFADAAGAHGTAADAAESARSQKQQEAKEDEELRSSMGDWELQHEIHQDVARTYSGIHYFRSRWAASQVLRAPSHRPQRAQQG
jgi:hypothetical protein